MHCDIYIYIYYIFMYFYIFLQTHTHVYLSVSIDLFQHPMEKTIYKALPHNWLSWFTTPKTLVYSWSIYSWWGFYINQSIPRRYHLVEHDAAWNKRIADRLRDSDGWPQKTPNRVVQHKHVLLPHEKEGGSKYTYLFVDWYFVAILNAYQNIYYIAV